MKETVIAKCPNGTYQGFYENGVAQFRGIPFARVQRWKRPFPVETTEEDLIDATQYGPSPWQVAENEFSKLLGSGILAEDSLNLNLFTADLSKQKKAVMVWITGGAQVGGNNVGSAHPDGEHPFDGSAIVREHPDVLVLAVNYRLGFWGSVDLTCFSDFSEEYRYSNNLARLDILEALKWVKQNIAGFGGDPDNVTLFGQSAGSNNITSLFLMPEATPYYQKAICQSSFSIDISVTKPEDAKMVSAEFFKTLGVTTLKEALEVSNEMILEKQGQLMMGAMMGTSVFADLESKFLSTVIDGVSIPFDYWEYLMSGALKGKQIILGCNQGEYDQQFVPFLEPERHQEAREFTIRQNWGKLDPIRGSHPEITEQYQALGAGMRDDFTTWKDLKNDLYQRVGAISYAMVLSEFTDTYMYYMTYGGEGAGRIRCGHGTEMGALFDYNSSMPQEFKKYVRVAWATFAKTGNPNEDGREVWRKFDKKSFHTLLLDVEPKTVPGVRMEEVKLLAPTFREYRENEEFAVLWS